MLSAAAIDELLRSAHDASRRREFNSAERAIARILEHAPANAPAHYALGLIRFMQGRVADARPHIERAFALDSSNPEYGMALAVILKKLDDRIGEANALQATLTAEPYFLPALLQQGDLLEREGAQRAASAVYRNALKVMPIDRAPAEFKPAIEHAARIVESAGRELAAHIANETATAMTALGEMEAERWREAGAILAGQSMPYVIACNRLHIPRLPAIPFYDRSAFPWVAELESQTAAIVGELHALLESSRDGFQAYVAFPDGAPVNQWEELNHSKRWSSYFLWRDGAPVADAHARCPRTTAALREVGMAEIGGLCPNAMFSKLAPHTRIPPHHGETNARLVVHLPLIVPDNCVYRVGFERRHWRMGEVLIFDDTLEHEARNDSDDDRVVLIFDVWNPYLSTAERDMVQAISAATRSFYSEER